MGVIRDISITGCLLSTRARLRQSQQQLIAVPLGGGGELRLAGTVVRGHEGAGAEWGGYGVRFDRVGGDEGRALGRIIAEARRLSGLAA